MVGPEAKTLDLAARMFPDALYKDEATHDAIWNYAIDAAIQVKRLGITSESFVAFMVVLLASIPAMVMAMMI